MQTNKSYKIGLLALCSFAILYYGFLFLKGHNIFSKYNNYRISYPVNKNLTVSAPVKLKGHVVGMVKKIEIVPKQNYSTLVTIEVDKKFPLTENSRVMLNNAGVMEGNALELELHDGKPLSRGSVIIGQVHPDFNDVDLQTMTAQVSTITSNLIKTTEGINAILGNLEKTSLTLFTAIDSLQYNVSTIAKNIVAISMPLADPLQGVSTMVPSINRILSRIESLPFKDVSCSVTRMLQNAAILLQNVSSDQGTLGLLINDATLYKNLNYTAKNLDALLFDIRRQPRRYVHFSLFSPKQYNQKQLTGH
jgi:phospholipid/cholesterol/gamma-HCH transport system substrate-binding protein